MPIDTCIYKNLALVVEWSVALSVPCNTWIFLARVRAIYHDSRFIKWSFLGLWCGTLIALGTPFTYKLTSIPLGDDLCFTAFTFHRNVEVISLSLVVLFDTAVMVAISIRMMSYSLSDSWKSKVFSLVFGNEMGHTSRLLLKSSQIYYL